MPLRDAFIREHGSNMGYLTSIDGLITLLRTHNCANIREKALQFSGLDGMRSFIAELRFAEYFVSKGLSVSFILESGANGCKSPDFSCDFKGESSLVEVTSLTEDAISATIVDLMHRLFEVMPYFRAKVTAELNDELSIPRTKREDRHKQNLVVMRSIGDFIVQLCKYPFRLPDEIDTEGIRFLLHPASTKQGRLELISRSVIQVPTGDLQSRVAEDLTIKARKRPSFNSDIKSLKFYVAYHCEESMVDSISIEDLLYGDNTSFGDVDGGHRELVRKEWQKITENPGQAIRHWDEIQLAAKNGWERFLIEKHLIPNNFTYLSNPGIFLSDLAMKNVTGVVFRAKWGSVHFFPNPFCSQEINLRGQIPSFLKS